MKSGFFKKMNNTHFAGEGGFWDSPDRTSDRKYYRMVRNSGLWQ
jgi:hypothetical protein